MNGCGEVINARLVASRDFETLRIYSFPAERKEYELTIRTSTYDYSAKTGEIRPTLAAYAREVDETGRFPGESVDTLRKAGLFGLCVPTEFGGAGETMRMFASVVEDLASECPSTAMIYVMHSTASQAIAASTALDDRREVLREIAAGKHLTTLAFSEPGSRSQFWAPVSKLESDGNGGYIANASKSWVTAADHADSYVSSSQAPGAESALESTIYLVRRTSPGVRTSGTFHGIGLRGNNSSPVALESVRISQKDLISSPGDGATTMLQVVLPWFSIGTAAMANGISRAAVEGTAKHMSTTRFEHSGTELRELPTLRARLADMSVRAAQSRALLDLAISNIEAGADTAPLTVLQARLSAIEAAVEVTDLAMKACGGAAFSQHLSIERFFRDARAGWVMAPTADHLRDFIGRSLTGLPLF